MARLSKEGGKKLLLVTLVGITGYILGSLMHSEILHFFAEVLGIK